VSTHENKRVESLTTSPREAPRKPFNGEGRLPSPELDAVIARACVEAGGWLSFDRFMHLALYTPGLGYYSGGRVTFGRMPGGLAGTGAGSDFVTAPEMSPLFGRLLGRQVRQALQVTGTREVWEFGAGTGALCSQILQHESECQKAGEPSFIQKYTIVDVSGAWRGVQRERLAVWGDRVRWADQLPDQIEGVVLGNEVLDAMPVRLLARRGGVWHERGVSRRPDGDPADAAVGPWVWVDRPTDARPPVEVEGTHDHVTEIHPHAEAFVRTLADRLVRGAVLLIDYGFPESEYYHPQRHMGTLACHQAHRVDDRPLERVGEKDLTAHVNFTGVALAAQSAGLEVLGYTTQGRFLINLGWAECLDALPLDAAGVAARAMAARLVNEHEMGELFKVLMLAPPASAQGWCPRGVIHGDRTHTL
jgi:SAM-dependent MidA family methyltransferase